MMMSNVARVNKNIRNRRGVLHNILFFAIMMSSFLILVPRASARNLPQNVVAFASPRSRAITSSRQNKHKQAARASFLTSNSAARISTKLPSFFQQRLSATSLQATTSKRSTSTTTTTKTKAKATKKSSTAARPYKLVIVESPSKCKTIEKILMKYVDANNLPHDYIVTSCYGHLRNLPKNNQELLAANLEVPDKTAITSKFPYKIVGVDLEHEYQPTYVMLPNKEALLETLQTLSDGAETVLLATDPDREGEAIAWHLQQVLGLIDDGPNNDNNNNNNDDKKKSERLTFTEITPRAIEAAVGAPEATSLNTNLVAAQETRRILDRLAGFTVSPVLWKKIAPGLSAGRVQSVGMALVVQRERERLVFQSMDYFDVQGNFSLWQGIVTADSDFIQATLSKVNGTNIVSGKSDFVVEDENTSKNSSFAQRPKPKPKAGKYLLTKSDAADLTELFNNNNKDDNTWQVQSVTGRERLAQPPEPFKTSTLQQESNQRLGMSVSQTMRTAQQLYEAGWISYMRTDSTYLSSDAQAATVQGITERHGPDYVNMDVSANKKKKKKKQKKSDQADKVAQEAHEAIRPAIQEDGTFADPQDITKLSESALSLYELILRRTLSSRMQPQKTNQTSLVIEGTAAPDGSKTATVVEFRATGSVVLEPGFTLEWNRGGDPTNANRELPQVAEGQDLSCHELEPLSHTTQPPARYTEASLVKELEALGVGRPSTYAGIVQILRDRAYVGSPTSDTAQTRSSNARKATGAAITAQRAAGGGDLFGARGPLAPSLSAFVVTSLLEQYCPTYVDPSFTAQMEENLDRIANGNDEDDDDDGRTVAEQRVAYLNEFYAGEQGLAAQIKRIDDQVDAEDARRANLPALERPSGDAEDGDGEDIGIYIGPWGPYIQQKRLDGTGEPVKASLPPGMATDLSTITPGTLKILVETKLGDGTVLGQHPEDDRNIRLKVGRYGAYLQLGETGEEGTTSHSLPKQMSAMRNLQVVSNDDDDTPNDVSNEKDPSLGDMIGVSLEAAVGYCGLPRTVSMLNDKPIIAAIGPYGPYLKYNNKFMSLHPRDGDVLTIEAEASEQLVTDGIINKKAGFGQGVLAELGEKDGAKVTVKKGRFGDYLNWNKVNAKLPAEYMDDPEQMPLEDAWVLIQEKAASTPSKGSKKGTKSNLPPAPKRSKSSYLYFCSEHRPNVAKTETTLGKVSKKLAELWANTADEDRKQYETLAQAGKEEYMKEKLAWEEECRKLGGKKPGKSSRAASGPKRPRSSYLYFCGAHRDSVAKTQTKLGDISKKLAEMWAETTDRSEYTALADADKVRYEAEKLQYASNPGSFTTATTSNAASTRRGGVKGIRKAPAKKMASIKKKGKNKGLAAKSKRAPSAYMIFCRETRNEIVDENGEKLPLGETTKRLAMRWKARDEETRVKFDSMAAEEKDKLMVEA